MIRDIETWRNELTRLRADFEKACMQNVDFEIERTLYYSALVVRKFSETPFVRRGFLGAVLQGHTFALAKGCLDGANWTGAKFHFDFRNPVDAQVSLLQICHTLIHSRLLEWRPATGQVQKIVAAGVREAIEFSPSEYSSLLQKVENYKFRRGPRKPARRAA
jgi:hypothetical protein